MDSGQAITIGQPGVHDYDVEAEARAMAPRATRYQVVVDTDRPETQMAAGHDDIRLRTLHSQIGASRTSR
jgi:hypothetical protein